MDDKITIIEGAYGIIPPDAMTVNEILYHQCEYIKEHAVKGDTGDAATVKVGTTTTLPPGSEASVSNSGDEHNAVFNFALPHGDKGETGATFTPAVSPEGEISWTNDKGLPDPEPANIRGQKGDTGAAATVKVGTVTTLPAGSQATVENVGDEHNAVFDFALPQGAQGEANVVANPTVDSDSQLEKIEINGTRYNITRIINAVESVAQIYETTFAVGENINLPINIDSNLGDLIVLKFENLAASGEKGVLFALNEGVGGGTCRLLAVISDTVGGGLTAQTYTFDGTITLAQFMETLKVDGAANIVNVVPQSVNGGIRITTTETTPRSFDLTPAAFSVSENGEIIVAGMLFANSDNAPTGIKAGQIMVINSGGSDPTDDMMLIIGGEDFSSGIVNCNAVPAANWKVIVYRHQA